MVEEKVKVSIPSSLQHYWKPPEHPNGFDSREDSEKTLRKLLPSWSIIKHDHGTTILGYPKSSDKTITTNCYYTNIDGRDSYGANSQFLRDAGEAVITLAKDKPG